MELNIIILAAGFGTRMKSNLPKAMHLLGNAPLIEHILQTTQSLKAHQRVVVLNENIPQLVNYIAEQKSLIIAYQDQPQGSADAVLSAESVINPKLTSERVTLVVYADTPLVSIEKLQALVDLISNQKADIAILAFESATKNKYGKLRIVDNQVVAIIEEDERSDAEVLTLCNSGVIAFNHKKIWPLLQQINNKNSKQEYYLTDIIALANSNNLTCKYVLDAEDKLQGANSKLELAQLEQVFQANKRYEFLQQGVQLIDANSVYFSLDTKIAQDVIIYPNVYIYPKVVIGKASVIYPFSVLEGVNIGENCKIGPFARLRPQSTLVGDNKVGNFVELKQTKIQSGVKISHLSYIGDSEIGAKTNIGAGTITCNYDGIAKHKTIIGENSFIGSNTALVAPVKIGSQVTLGAGSTITKDVPDNTLAIARCFQKHLLRSRLNAKNKNTKNKNTKNNNVKNNNAK